MRFTADYRHLFDHIEASAHEAGADILSAVQAALPHGSGALAASYRLDEVSSAPGHTVMAISSDLPYARPIERGAWMRSGRGPHISGSGPDRHVLRNKGKGFGRRMNARLRKVA